MTLYELRMECIKISFQGILTEDFAFVLGVEGILTDIELKKTLKVSKCITFHIGILTFG